MSEHTSDVFHNALARRLWKSECLQPVCCSNYRLVVGSKTDWGPNSLFELRSLVNSHPMLTWNSHAARCIHARPVPRVACRSGVNVAGMGFVVGDLIFSARIDREIRPSI